MDFLKRYAGTTFNALVEAEGHDDNMASGLEKGIFEKIRQPSDSSEPASDPEEPASDPEEEEEGDTEEDKGEDEAKMEPVLQPRTPPLPPWRTPHKGEDEAMMEPVLQPTTPPFPPWRIPPPAHDGPENPAQRLLDLEAEVARLRREQGFPPSIPCHPPASHELQEAMEQLQATAAAGTGASNSSSSGSRPVSKASAFNYGPAVNDQSVRVFDNGHLPFFLL